MRSDYILYVIGIALLIVVGYVLLNVESLQAPLGGRLIYSAVVFVVALFGTASFIFAYGLRPKTPRQHPPETPPEHETPSTDPSPAVQSLNDLTQVRGIGTRRAAQLKALGVNTVADLSTASSEALAKKLNVSPKRTSRWIGEARKHLLEPDQDQAKSI